jgi:hypothetical protein
LSDCKCGVPERRKSNGLTVNRLARRDAPSVNPVAANFLVNRYQMAIVTFDLEGDGEVDSADSLQLLPRFLAGGV